MRCERTAVDGPGGREHSMKDFSADGMSLACFFCCLTVELKGVRVRPAGEIRCL